MFKIRKFDSIINIARSALGQANQIQEQRLRWLQFKYKHASHDSTESAALQNAIQWLEGDRKGKLDHSAAQYLRQLDEDKNMARRRAGLAPFAWVDDWWKEEDEKGNAGRQAEAQGDYEGPGL
ncbi:hypothetical protein ACLMJK_005288 [Lecanora helva]